MRSLQPLAQQLDALGLGGAALGVTDADVASLRVLVDFL